MNLLNHQYAQSSLSHDIRAPILVQRKKIQMLQKCVGSHQNKTMIGSLRKRKKQEHHDSQLFNNRSLKIMPVKGLLSQMQKLPADDCKVNSV